MLLSTDLEGRNLLDDTIYNYYRKNGNRHVRNFLHTEDKVLGWYFTHFIVNRKHVIRYGFGRDREFMVGGVELGIGPHYFGAADYWSYENFQRFTIEASTEGVEHNLALLDEFWGKENAI
jgi:hypothetical protein